MAPHDLLSLSQSDNASLQIQMTISIGSRAPTQESQQQLAELCRRAWHDDTRWSEVIYLES